MMRSLKEININIVKKNRSIPAIPRKRQTFNLKRDIKNKAAIGTKIAEAMNPSILSTITEDNTSVLPPFLLRSFKTRIISPPTVVGRKKPINVAI